MSRYSDTNDGSLELLLDTICNTFGGVLFISILVVLLLNMTSNEAATTPPSEATDAELSRWRARLEEANDEMQRLQSALRQQQLNELQVVDPDVQQLVRTLMRSQRLGSGMMQQKSAMLGEISRSQADVNEISKELRALSDTLASSQQNLEQIEERLQREIASRTRAAKLPRAKATVKEEIPMFLRNGRLTAYAKRSANGLVPSGEVEEKQDAAGQPYVEPKTGAGIPVHLGGDNSGEIDARIGEFDSDQHYLAIFVWPDSFEHFAIIKDRMVSKSFDYRLVPFPEGEKIAIGATSQDVVVQ